MSLRLGGGIRRRLALAIVVTALIPMLAALWLVETTLRQASERFFVPEIGAHLDEALGLYQELARSVKQGMRQEALALSRDPALVRALRSGDQGATKRALQRLVAEQPALVSISVDTETGASFARAERANKADQALEHQLPVSFDLDEASVAEALKGGQFSALLATDKQRFEGLDAMSQFIDHYRQVEARRLLDEDSYVLAFAVLLGVTILAAIGVGVLTAAGVSRRVLLLQAATRRAGQGDLSTRVPTEGTDELSDLARTFNRMLLEIAESRSRIEYLQRISAWQEMARRLAHEIKNPLTPIQLAVQEIHQRYRGTDPEYRALVDATLEIVEDEVGTLHRLVSEFSSFARLPEAKLEVYDLVAFLSEQKEQLSPGGDEPKLSAQGLHEWRSAPGVQLSFELPPEDARIKLDRQMLRRALINLIRNGAEAIQGRRARPKEVTGRTDSGERSETARTETARTETAGGELKGSIAVRLHREGEHWLLDIDDSGPGIPPEHRETVFDPYFTTRTEGTGLGLAIVKKIVVEHGGTISALESPLGGARMRVSFPALQR